MRAPAAALAIVLLSVLLSPLGRELYVGDETKYSQVVREMRAGSFFLPTLNGSPFTHKPPLHFWAVDLLTYVFGVFSIWPFVLPSLISFALLLVLMHRFGGPFAAFVCGTSLLMWGSAQTARMDVAFAALLALAAYRIHRADGALPIAAGVATGFAFLVKGPMAPVIILALFAFESFHRKRKPNAKDALALLPMLLLPLLWLVPAIVIGGEPYWREIFYKQTVGRAVGAWVHKSPPWFYLVRAPLTLMPWFFLAVAALIRRRDDERSRFAISWILAVLVPYTLLSSKLDVYMIAMLPAVALLIARYVDGGDDAWGRRANVIMLSLLAIIGAAGLFVQPHHIKEEDGALIARLDVRALFAILLVAAIVAMVITLRGRLAMSTLATGLVLVVTLGYAAIALVPLANEMASTRPLVSALATKPIPRAQIALFMCPHLWVRGMDPSLSRARHLDAEELHSANARVIVTRRKDAEKIADVLQGYRRTGELRMIGKWFDVYEPSHD
ncbi:MAG TPA: glycosyltransferase family 39 protein [Thermoanaerobaculia bacterium]|nr:glycosyltransferase family 39 protein [Thermoanaerobaculia bacterium]